jgi:hypothetical protein
VGGAQGEAADRGEDPAEERAGQQRTPTCPAQAQSENACELDISAGDRIGEQVIMNSTYAASWPSTRSTSTPDDPTGRLLNSHRHKPKPSPHM